MKSKKLYFDLWIWRSIEYEREVIRWAMCKLGVDEWLVSAVMSMYMGARTVVRLP